MAWYDKLLGGSSEETSLDEALEKAQKPTGKSPAPKAFEFDPMDLRAHLYQEELKGDFHEGTAGIAYGTLRRMARVPAISAIINTRINQVAEFSVPQATPHSVGYNIVMRDFTKEPSPAALKRMAELSRWVGTCGDPRITPNNSFEIFLRKIIRDSLIFDQACFEVVRARGGKIAGFVPVDATTIRMAKVTEKEREAGRRDAAQSAYVQIIGNKVTARFTDQEMVFGVRRPRTWIKVNGYGYPELEELVRTVTQLVNLEMYNANNFTHGMHAAGILAVKSKMNPQLFRAFRREFYSMLSGAAQSKKTPIIQLDPENKEELQSINLSQSNKDMEFSQFLGWLLKLACAVYQIDAAELGIVYGAENMSSALATQGPADKITASRERGLRPLLRAVQSWLNRIIYEVDPDFEFRFAGFDAKTEEQQLDADIKSLKAFRTVNEVRAMHDLKPLDSPVADMILDPTYIQMTMGAQEEAEGGEEGYEDEDEAEGGEEASEEPEDKEEASEEPEGDEFEKREVPEAPEETAKSLTAGRVKSITVEVE